MSVALLALLLTAHGAEPFKRLDKRDRRDRSSRMTVAPPIFEFAPTSGTGLPYVQDICDYAVANSLLTGDTAWCLKGDGTSWNDGLELSAVGSPTTQTRSLCPNGPDCADATRQYFDSSSDYYASASGLSLTSGDLSCFALMSTDDVTAGGDMISKWGATEADRSFWVDINGAGAAVLYVSNGTDSGSTTNVSAVTSRGISLVAFRYRRVGGAADNLAGVSANGGAFTTVTNARLMNLSSTGARFIVGAVEGGGGNVGPFYGAGCTEAFISDDQIAAMARAVLADTPTGTKGETMTFTRSSTKSCTGPDGNITVLPANRPCITGGGIHIESASTSLGAINSEAVDGWANLTNVVVTANDATAPDGTLTAEKVADNSTSAAHAVNPGAITTTASQSVTYSVWIRKGTHRWVRLNKASGTAASAYFDLDNVTTGTLSNATAGITCYSNNWCRLHIVVDGSLISTSHIFGVNLASANGTISYSGSGTFVHIWGYQVEQNGGFSPTSYIRTTSASVTRAADSIYFAKPANYSDAAGCFGVSLLAEKVPAPAYVIAGTTGYSAFNTGPTSIVINDASVQKALAVSDVTGSTVRVRGYWYDSTMKIQLGAAEDTAAYDGTFFTGSNIYLGSSTTPANHINGTLSRVVLDRRVGGCRP